MRIDHVILGARTIGPLREWLRDEHGLGITDGSPNPDGTASWVVPMDTPLVQYLELLVVDDVAKLSSDDFGRTFLDRTAAGPAFLNWAALVDDIATVAQQVAAVTGGDPGLLEGVSVRADGQQVPWAEAAFADSWARPCRPFFLSYGDPASRRDRVAGDLAAAAHDTVPTGIARLGITMPDPANWAAWPGAAALAVTAEGGADGVDHVVLTTGGGEVVLRWP
ncbi:hypothetical protein GCM10011609_06600 [Lentzea pudingi]|uniref:Glyoxalase-like domain-containing protein n=1 Tax=Lentzea pudingi TaxID=1789439 RepID=A0ABQ2HAU9_9PSEU|nr:VOC family protein [Lentzea pudingi]GGM73490.1 hypothetical protein GCM10011609_06600 [Lentzea pudingi]